MHFAFNISILSTLALKMFDTLANALEYTLPPLMIGNQLRDIGDFKARSIWELIWRNKPQTKDFPRVESPCSNHSENTTEVCDGSF